tara:strand:- start:1675 stop:2169 length:495 start_codon:yes stop_codon:yes gene_type:complete
MTTLTYTQLNNILYKLLIVEPNYPFLYGDAFTNYYNLGVRPSELMDIDLWSIDTNNNIILQPLKSNNIRTFTNNECSTYLIKSIVNQTPLYSPINAERLKQYFKRFVSVYPLFVGKKQQEVNLFRHRYVKYLSIQGLTSSQITSKMGYIHPNTVFSYLNSDITY